MAESKGYFGVLKSIDDKEAPKNHPKMPPSSFPIPLPGRNRYGYNWGWRQKMMNYQTGHTNKANANGSNEQSSLRT